MKNKILIGSLITTLLAFMLYSASLKRTENANLAVEGPKQVIKTKKGKVVHEPKVARVEYSTQVKVAAGSDKKWANKVARVMGKDQSYQVVVQDLQTGKFAQVANSSQTHGVCGTSRLFLLAAISYQEQHGKLSEHTVVKVKKVDRAKGERMLQPGIGYGVSYLKQSMMRGSKTAGNALVRKIKPANLERIMHKMGGVNTKFSKKYTSSPTSRTTAVDLAKVMTNLYRDKTLSRQYSNQVLSALNEVKNKAKVVRSASGLVYGIGDEKSSVALVQSHGHAYCISVWSNNDRNFVKLGKKVASFFK